jgi:hypothetical protein
MVIGLSNKNKTLGFISDDSRQVSVLKEIYEEILNESVTEDDCIIKDSSLNINFITYNHYVISQENIINSIFENYTIDNNKNNYTLSNSFNLKKLTLTVKLEKDDNVTARLYTYKLSMNKKENKINYKLIKTEYIGG